MTARPMHGRLLARTGRAAVVATAVAVLAACGTSDPGSDDDGSTDGGEVTTPRVAFTTNPQPTYVNTWDGPITHGGQFGFDFSKDDFTIFESHSTGTQALLSGEAEVLGGSFISTAALREKGQDLRVFCPFNNADTLALVARNGITTAEQVFDPETRVATDSPGGAGSMVMNALFEALDAPGLIDDLTNTQILESSSLRANAFAADQVDVAVIHVQQFAKAESEVPDGVILATLADDVPELIMQAFAADASWLEANRSTAVDFCASVLLANRTLSQDYDAFVAAVNEYVSEPPATEDLEQIFDVINRSDVWPTDGLRQSAVDYTLDLGFRSGILTEEADGAEVADLSIVEDAVKAADAAQS